MSDTPRGKVEERLQRLESVVREQQEIIAELTSDGEPSDEIISVDRRGALQTGGLLGLLGLGVTTAGADPSGQVGTENQPLATLHAETVESDRIETDELDGDIADGEGPITSFSTGASGGSVAVRDSGGELAVADASDADHAIARSQAILRNDDVDWTGQHDFGDMLSVGGHPIVESDSNSDGRWTRWADGTQLVTAVHETEAHDYNSHGSGYRSTTFDHTYPASFASGGERAVAVNPESSGLWVAAQDQGSYVTFRGNYWQSLSGRTDEYLILAAGPWD